MTVSALGISRGHDSATEVPAGLVGAPVIQSFEDMEGLIVNMGVVRTAHQSISQSLAAQPCSALLMPGSDVEPRQSSDGCITVTRW